MKKKISAMLWSDQIVTTGEGKKCEKSHFCAYQCENKHSVCVQTAGRVDGRVKFKRPEEPLAAKSKVHIKSSS